MAEENANSYRPTASVVISSTSEHEGSENDCSNPISSSDDSVLSGNIASSSSNCEEQTSNDGVSQSHDHLTKQSRTFNDPDISSSSENNGVAESETKLFLKAPGLVLRPSSFNKEWKNSLSAVKSTADSSSSIRSPLRSPKLNLTTSVSSAGTSTSELTFSKSNPPSTFIDNLFTKSQTDSSVFEDVDSVTSSNPDVASKAASVANHTAPTLSVPNFVFGQNLHERVASDSVKAVDKSQPEPSCSNGNSEMLFTTVLNKSDGTNKDNLNKEGSLNLSNGRGESTSMSTSSSSLYEDAARYQEARSNKRKYEEVMITTGEEEENNILQVNVKLFAFDNGSWLERGRGTLRLNDKIDNGVTTSRIVIRTLGSLRVVLNTKIWSGMSLKQASEKSIRLTALDNNGQLKIFLIQSSPKDMSTLYRCLETRLEKCKDNTPSGEDDGTTSESPDKRIALSPSVTT